MIENKNFNHIFFFNLNLNFFGKTLHHIFSAPTGRISLKPEKMYGIGVLFVCSSLSPVLLLKKQYKIGENKIWILFFVFLFLFYFQFFFYIHFSCVKMWFVRFCLFLVCPSSYCRQSSRKQGKIKSWVFGGCLPPSFSMKDFYLMVVGGYWH